jgi:NADPH:quinone reductase-like Zn-dependent oxidoreductase
VAGDDEAVVTVTAAALKPSDRFMAAGVHYAPTTLPQVVGLDGVGRLEDGARVAFFAPQRPYRGMADQALVRRDVWFPLGDAAAPYDNLLQWVAAGEIVLDVDPVPLADVEKTWPRAGSDRRVVFVP